MAVRNRRQGSAADDTNIGSDDCCSVHFVKYIMLIFNFLFYISGFGLLALGLWTLNWKWDYVAILTPNYYQYITYVVIGTGLCTLLFGVIGCLAVWRINRCLLFTFTILLIIILVVESLTCAAAYLYSEEIGRNMPTSLNRTIIDKYSVDARVSLAVRKLHLRHKCCGSETFMDWRQSKWYMELNREPLLKERGFELYVPDFCCRSPSEMCGKRDHPSNIYYDGCARSLEDELRRQMLIISAAALAIALIQIFGIIFSCCLFVKLKEYRALTRKRRSNGYYS